ncbi:hypothetical protein [Moellerella wisconsensis]|uniref:Uncharacterized protein n=1 Tax=Moellerella wisconsensis TaxID=158849 RepID=A0ACD3YAM0_9GAMM|nr:hypothetical protein [Moellerella wisconsensis]UNH40212.1 hypothetical protein MNY70_07225 [Moellerella wisconsensis]
MSKRDFSLFYFATTDRPYFLDKHTFYVAEARKRLFAQFSDSDLEAEAQQKEKDYYETAGKRFDPDYDDEGAIWEQAYHEVISHLIALSDMKNTVSLALTAGMFHQFDKELRQKCIREFSHWLDTKTVTSMIWDISLTKLIEMLEWIGMNITSKAYYAKIDICRQVVNVYKHGDGHAHRELSAASPEYYQNFNIPAGYQFSLGHEQLEVTETQFIEFADAITAFWNDIPTHCMRSAIREKPEWFAREYKKHENKVKNLQS